MRARVRFVIVLRSVSWVMVFLFVCASMQTTIVPSCGSSFSSDFSDNDWLCYSDTTFGV